MSAYFIAGTGTGVGKTFTTCALVHAARGQGRPVRAFKPVISGYRAGEESDLDLLLAALGDDSCVQTIAPWRFAAPLSPDMAAQADGRPIDFTALCDWTRAIAARSTYGLIETVGGLMVPLDATRTTRDWMHSCALPLVLVTGSYLGALSHTLSTVEAARAVGLAIAALVINESDASPVPLAATQASLANHLRDIPLILAQPRVASPRHATVIHLLGEQLP